MYLPITTVQSTDDMVELELNPSESPSFLGDARTDSGAVNKIIPTSHYGRLPRPSIQDLPGLHSADRKFYGTSSEAKAAELAGKKIHGGEFTLTAKRATDNEPDIPVTYYTISAVVSGGYFEGPLIEVSFHHENGTAPDRLEYHCGCEDGKKFRPLLRESQQLTLYARLIHLFLRALGAWVGPEAFHFLVDSLEVRYSETSWRKEFLDLYLICADVSFNVHMRSPSDILPDRHGSRIAKILVRLGECLEAVQKNKAASNLYLEIVEEYWNPDDPELEKAQLINMAAVALGNAGNYKEAEALLLRALKIESSRKSWDKAHSQIVSNLAKFYPRWIDLEPNVWAEKSHSFVASLVSLLIIAEANVTEDVKGILPSLMDKHHKDPMAASRVYLKSKFATKKAAQKALSAAVSKHHDNGANFREELRKYCTRKELSIRHNSGTNLEQLKMNYYKMQKEETKAYLRPKGEATMLSCCGYMGCKAVLDSENLLRCPCDTIFYCERTCQVADWKAHKKICPWKLNQKAKKGI